IECSGSRCGTAARNHYAVSRGTEYSVRLEISVLATNNTCLCPRSMANSLWRHPAAWHAGLRIASYLPVNFADEASKSTYAAVRVPSRLHSSGNDSGTRKTNPQLQKNS